MSPQILTRPAAASPSPRSGDPVMAVPYVRAAYEHEEPLDDHSQLLDASQHQYQVDVPAYGYMRNIYLLVEAAGGASGVATAAAEDAPWSVIGSIELDDVNGSPLFGPYTGYELYLVNKWGGYFRGIDPKELPDFSAVAVGGNASGNFSFGLRLPVEISRRDGLGDLANQNASSTYKLKYTFAAASSVYSTAPSVTLPTVRIRATLEAFSQPPSVDLRNNPQASAPPAHGTAQYWSKQIPAINNGANTVRLSRVGNMIRQWIFIIRATSDGTRATGAGTWPDPMSVFWDSALMHSLYLKKWKRVMVERSGYKAAAETAGGIDNGVFVYDFCHDFDGKLGWEMRDGWLPTVQSSRIELQGSFSAAGTLTVLTNDVAPKGDVFLD